MRLWLKFDSSSAITNSACLETRLNFTGTPIKLPQNRGIFRNWGFLFQKDAAISFQDGLRLCGKKRDWSV